jgi:poly(ADP-ribose) glycohydrolase
MPFYYSILMEQVSKKGIDRELIKAYAGFKDTPKHTDIITGNWGCGAFNGDIKTKFLIQWLACSMADKKMVYCPFDSKETIESSLKILSKLQKKTVGKVYELFIKAGSSMKTMQENIFEKIN